MRTSFQAAVALLCLVVPAHAQTAPWIELRPEGQGFALWFPGTPSYIKQPATADTGYVVVDTWAYEPRPEVVFLLGASEIPAAAMLRADATTQLSAAVRGQFERMPAGSTIKYENPIDIAGFQGREAVFQMADGIAKTRVFIVGNRLYQVIAITSRPDAWMPDIDRFLRSFALVAR